MFEFNEKNILLILIFRAIRDNRIGANYISMLVNRALMQILVILLVIFFLDLVIILIIIIIV